MEILNGIPDQEFESVAEVLKAVGASKRDPEQG